MSQVNRKLRKLSVLSFLMAMLVAIGFTPLETALAATTIQVTTTSDNSTGVLVVDGTCTLREAIRTANTDVQYDTCGPSTNGTAVTGPYTINVNIGGGGTIVVAGSQGTDTNIQGDYDLLKPMSIINTSGANVVLTTSSTCGVSSNLPCDRVFDDRNPSGDILIQGFTVDNAGQATPGRLNGGAIRKSTGTGTLFLNRMTVSDSLGIKGGGIAIFGGSLNLSNSTVSGNNANGAGGGLYVVAEGGGNVIGTVTITNSTFSANTTQSNSFTGSAIYQSGGTSLTIVNSTIYDNHQGTAGLHVVSTTLVLQNTIVSHNTVEAAPGTTTSNCTLSTVTTTGSTNNIGTSPCPNIIADLNADLGALANNGGPTLTHSLPVGSNAIDAGEDDAATAAGLTTDQRGTGFPRFVNNAAGTDDVDIGAYELESQDTTSPSVTINQAAGQDDPTNTSPVNFTVVFSEPIVVADFTDTDINLSSSTATTSTVTITNPSADRMTFNVAVAVTSSGDVVAVINANAVTDDASNPNTASTSTDNTVTYDNTAPTVTINQAVGQDDPALVAPIHFTVVFSEPVSDFGDSDVTLGGTANPTSATVTETAPNDGTTYDVAVSGMAGAGTVTASLNAAVATDEAGNPSDASTSIDNQVTFAPVVPVVTGIVRADPNPTTSQMVDYDVTFSEDVTGVDAGDFELVQTGVSGASITGVTGSGANYVVTVDTGTGSGTLQLNLNDDDSIQDTDTNPLGGPGAGNGDFDGQIYDVRPASDEDDEDDEDDSQPAQGQPPAAPAQTFLCNALLSQTNGAMSADGGIGNVEVDGVFGDTYCHVINQNGVYVTNSGEIGNLDIINLGVVQALDVFALLPGGISVTQFNSPVRICLNGTGRVYFISAFDGSVQELSPIQSGGYRCVDLWTAGKVVLAGGSPGTGNVPPAAPASPADTTGQSQTLTGCMVTTDGRVNLRSTPAMEDNVILVIPYDAENATILTALQKQGEWYQVDYLGTLGWLHQSVVTPNGQCGV